MVSSYRMNDKQFYRISTINLYISFTHGVIIQENNSEAENFAIE